VSARSVSPVGVTLRPGGGWRRSLPTIGAAALIEATIPLLIGARHGGQHAADRPGGRRREAPSSASSGQGVAHPSPRSGRASTRPRACGDRPDPARMGICAPGSTQSLPSGCSRHGEGRPPAHESARECVMNGGRKATSATRCWPTATRARSAHRPDRPRRRRLRCRPRPPRNCSSCTWLSMSGVVFGGVRTPIEPAEVVSLLLDGMLAPLPEQERDSSADNAAAPPSCSPTGRR